MKIDIKLFSISSVEAARTRVEEYRRRLKEKCAELVRRLAELGVETARVVFNTAEVSVDVDGGPPNPANVTVTVEDAAEDGESGYVCRIVASGEQVAFVEFGAGVHFNSGGDAWHETKPDGIVGIGEYGYGLGQYDSWSYTDDSGTRRRTHGTMEQPGMAVAASIMKDQVETIAREVFADD